MCHEFESRVQAAQLRPQHIGLLQWLRVVRRCKETLLTSAEGELLDLIDEFSDGRIQFAFVKVKDPNSSLPKNVLIAWV